MFMIKSIAPSPATIVTFFKAPLCIAVTKRVWTIVASLLSQTKNTSLLLFFLAGAYGIPLAIYLTLLSYVFFRNCINHFLLKKEKEPCSPFLLNIRELLTILLPLSDRASLLAYFPKESDS